MELARRCFLACMVIAFTTTRPADAETTRLVAPAQHRDVDIVLEGEAADIHTFADALVPLVENVDGVASVADGDRETRAFLAPRLWFFFSLEELRELREEVDARWDWEVSHETGTALDDGPPPDRSPPPRT